MLVDEVLDVDLKVDDDKILRFDEDELERESNYEGVCLENK